MNGPNMGARRRTREIESAGTGWQRVVGTPYSIYRLDKAISSSAFAVIPLSHIPSGRRIRGSIPLAPPRTLIHLRNT
jgi:hypothetical protein